MENYFSYWSKKIICQELLKPKHLLPKKHITHAICNVMNHMSIIDAFYRYFLTFGNKYTTISAIEISLGNFLCINWTNYLKIF